MKGVSIGYVGGVASILKPKALVQHGPWDVSDGGAGDVATGVACLDRWLVTQTQETVKWDVITFNFGLHDLTNGSHCEGLYTDQLSNVTARLVALKTKLLYVTTTPFMPLRLQGNTVVEDMNKIARDIMAPHNIPVVDLYKVRRLPTQPRFYHVAPFKLSSCVDSLGRVEWMALRSSSKNTLPASVMQQLVAELYSLQNFHTLQSPFGC